MVNFDSLAERLARRLGAANIDRDAVRYLSAERFLGRVLDVAVGIEEVVAGIGRLLAAAQVALGVELVVGH
jgi:hypothetical protein